MIAKELTFDSTPGGERGGQVSALWLRPRDAAAAYVLAHGAGAGMHHPFMDAMAAALFERAVATFRYQFPYMEKGSRRPDGKRVLLSTVRAAAHACVDLARGLPLIAGGKSMGGRMTSTAQAVEPLPEVRGLAFLGFPLHAPGKRGSERGDHLGEVSIPMLFLQGTRDKLAELELMRPVCDGLGSRATLHVVDGGDHSFKVLKRSGRTDDEVLAELADAVAEFAIGLG